MAEKKATPKKAAKPTPPAKKRAPAKRPAKPTKPKSDEREVIAAAVLRFMGQGLSCYKACKAAGVVNSTFLSWVDADKALADRYARAREDLIEHIASETIEIADEDVPTTRIGSYDSAAVQKQRLKVETRKWLLARLAPKKYGDRLALAGDETPIEVKSALDVSSLSTDVLAAIMAAKDKQGADDASK
jgi:hypothetical protein